jgi:hypothetical protein
MSKIEKRGERASDDEQRKENADHPDDPFSLLCAGFFSSRGHGPLPCCKLNVSILHGASSVKGTTRLFFTKAGCLIILALYL